MKIKLKGNYRKTKGVALFLFVLAFFSAFLSLFSFYLFRFKPVFQEKAECAAKNKANAILNSAISDAFDGINTDKYVNIILNNENSVTSINTNTGELNRIKTQIYKNLKAQAEKSGDAVIYIPIGSLTDYPALQGVGYKMPVKIIFDTSIEIDFAESLKEAGINQVYYEISVVATANLDVVSSLFVSETSITERIPVAQNLIVGTVPYSYGSGYEITRR